MPPIRNKTVSESNKDDLIIDVLCDLIVTDALKREPKLKFSTDELVDMRARLTKMDKISDMWYKLKEAEGK